MAPPLSETDFLFIWEEVNICKAPNFSVFTQPLPQRRNSKGSLSIPKWMNFWKLSEGGVVISDLKKSVAIFLALETTIGWGVFSNLKKILKKSQRFSRKMGGGVKGRSEIF